MFSRTTTELFGVPSLSPCLSPTELEQFLLGLTDEGRAEGIEDHLQLCDDCQQRLAVAERESGAEDGLIAALRQNPVASAAAAFDEVPSELVNLLIPHFKRIAIAFENTVQMAGDHTAATADFVAQDEPNADLAVPEDGLQSGRLGRYEVRGLLGRGGMGTVLHGFDPLLNRSIAIKVLQAVWLAQDGMAERLVREAQSAAAVEHDNIVPIYGVELWHGNPCIVMPLLKGETLQQRLQITDEPLPVGELLRIAREAATGLAAAHAAGLIHCDIKPANLWLEAPHGRVKILDFGLAIEHGDAGGQSGISGTPGYLAPEQARGEPLDPRTDIFSLGCVFYRIATGLSPFTGERRLKAFWTVLSDAPVPAKEINPDLPDELSDLIQQMLSRDPGDRPESAAAIVNVLDVMERREAERRGGIVRRRWLLAMFGAAVLSGAGVGTWAMFAAPPAAKPVLVTFLGDEPSLNIVVQRDGRDWPLRLGAKSTLSLVPGDYRVRTATAVEQRQLVPEQFVVAEQQPQVVRIAFVGELARHAQHTQAATGVAVAPGTQPPVIMSVGQDRALVRWDSKETTFENLNYVGRCIAVSPRGDEVATAGGNKTLPQETVIELRSPNRIDGPVRTLAGHTRLIAALAYSPDGQRLASADADGVLLWDRASGESQRLLSESADANGRVVHCLTFFADSRRLLAGGRQLTEWDLSTMSSQTALLPGNGTVRAVCLVQQGFAAAGDDGIVWIWTDINSEPREFANVNRPILTLAADREGTRLLTGDADGVLRIWSVTTGEVQGLLRGHQRAVQSVAFVGSGRQAVSAGADGTVRLWQLPFP